MSNIEDLIKSKIFFHDKPKRNCEKYFNKLKEISVSERFRKGKRLSINKSNIEVSYDSPYEKKIIEDLDKCSFVKEIKTQSLVIHYKSGKVRIRKYFPDIELLLDDGIIAIIEVKPFREMVNRHNLDKHRALSRYCRKHGFGLAILDHDYYSFEDLKREKVSKTISNKFIKFVKDRGNVIFEECEQFKKEYNIDDYQICNIVLNSKHLEYKQKKISYIN